MRRHRGLSLVEMMAGTLVVFLAASVMCAVLASSAHYISTERERSLALQMAWKRVHDSFNVSGYFVDDGWTQGDVPPLFTAPTPTSSPYAFQDAGYANNPYDLYEDQSQIGTPSGRTYTFESLSHAQNLADVTTVPLVPHLTAPFPNYVYLVAFVGQDSNFLVNIWDDSAPASATNPRQLPIIPPVPQPAPSPPIQSMACGLCVNANFTTLWASDFNSWGIHQNNNPQSGGTPWPPSTGRWCLPTNGEPTGICLNAAGTDMWTVDTAQRGLLHRVVSDPNPNDWDTTVFPQPPSPPLLLPANLAWDETNSVLWIADLGNLCLRSYTFTTGQWGTGTWSGTLRGVQGNVLMGHPRGVTVDASGTVYTADSLHLWSYNPPTSVWQVLSPDPLPTSPSSGLQYNIDSLHYNPNTGLIWIATEDGNLWKFDPTNQIYTWICVGR